jgi:hypothetical protein
MTTCLARPTVECIRTRNARSGAMRRSGGTALPLRRLAESEVAMGPRGAWEFLVNLTQPASNLPHLPTSPNV